MTDDRTQRGEQARMRIEAEDCAASFGVALRERIRYEEQGALSEPSTPEPFEEG